MTVKQLELINFRNYNKQTINFGEGINILYGQNAQGKTNILEALYISATGKSHRTNNYRDLIRHESNGFEVNLTATIAGRDNTISVKYILERGKYAEINGVKREKLSDILGTLNMILFSPETLEVIKGSPAVRRRFIDIFLCQTNRQYLHFLKRYNTLIKNKSIALKNEKKDKFGDTIPVWNEQISNYGGKIAYYRMKAINELNAYMKREIKSITGNLEESDMTYKTYCSFAEDADQEFFISRLSEELIKGLEKEKHIGQCIYGPHRDDFEILLNEMSSRQYCSQGQQRTLALSLIIAELFYVENIKGEKPVLLLDDVMSELDQSRQEYLLKGLMDVQTIITTTDELSYHDMKNRNIKKFFIEKGIISSKVDLN